MSAETLRRAAAQIRNDYGGIVSRTTLDGRRWLPVADWLAECARLWEYGDVGPLMWKQANAVARAHLGGDDSA